jgi:hypothetical protein
MGFFSWKTQDTDRSICNSYSNRVPFLVQMVDNNGNVWSENEYDGYGRFGNKDYYELLAEMNGIECDLIGEEYTYYMRGAGIDLAFKNNPSGVGTEGVLYPNLVEMAKGWEYERMGPDTCDFQGYFYDEEEHLTDTMSEDKYWKAVTTYSERNSITDEDLW